MLFRSRFGRNEGGVQHFHDWVQRFVDASDTLSLAEIMQER